MEKLRKYDLSKKDNDWKLVDRKTKKVVKKLGPTKKEATKKAAKILKEKDGVSLVIHNTNKSGITEERTYPKSRDPKKSKG